MAGIAVLAAMAGCAQAKPTSAVSAHQAAAAQKPGQPAAAPGDDPKALPVMTVVQRITAASITSGHLVFGGGCFYLAASGNGDRTGLVWPFGYTARANPLGVYDGQGKLVARPGDKVFLGGAGTVRTDIPTGTVTNTGCLAGAKDAWIIGSVS